jgi:hypothetical protein
MRVLFNVVLTLLLAISFGTQMLTASAKQQNEGQNAPQQQQAPPSEGQASRSAVVQSVTGCVVQGEHGYSLKTESDSYPIETDKDLSQYVNKKVKITGILEHHNTPTSTASGNTATVTDIRLRMIVSVVGDCHEPSK